MPLLESGTVWSGDARAAWDWLTASGDSPVVSLHDLQYFLWYQLPAKFLTSARHHQAVANALGELLSRLGYEDAASVATGLVTRRVLGEWEKSRSAGYRALQEAMVRSGVEPPDTDELSWGESMGLTEAGHYHAVASALEDAVDTAVLQPAEPGWRRRQAEVMSRYLSTPLPSLYESTPLAAIHEERQQFWADHIGRHHRQKLIRPVLDQLRNLPPPRPEAASHLKPLLRLLEVAATDPALTQAGYLLPAAVRRLVDEFFEWPFERPPRSEVDAPQVHFLRSFANEARLVRRSRSRLVLSPLGRRAAADPELLWSTVIICLARGSGFVSAIQELILARLLGGPIERRALVSEIRPAVAEAGWRPTSGGELTDDMVSFQFWDAIRTPELLGMIATGSRTDRGDHVRLTEFGISSARAILWHRSTAARRAP
jgi:hypothetical protein